MTKKMLHALAFSLFFAARMAGAEAIYPPAPDIRPLGMAQARTGSCMAEAQTTAMEMAFLERGMAVSISSYHAHAFNWKDNRDPKSVDSILQDYAPEDVGVFNHFGRFVPNYMLPEDGRGFDPEVEHRPAVSSYGVYDTDFPDAGATGQAERIYPLNGGSLAQIKQWVREKRPMILSIQGYLMNNETYNWETGLLANPWQPKNVVKGDEDLGVDHAVAIVGFDDDLVVGEGAPPGALIVRNSWNENWVILAPTFKFDPAQLSSAEQQDFQRMRGKINPAKIDVGFFAIPYQYLTHLSTQGWGDVKVYDIDYQKFYAAYTRFQPHYSTRQLPYYCEANSEDWIRDDYPQILKGARSGNAVTKPKAIKALTNLVSPALLSKPGWQGLKLARIARSDKLDRTHDFYNGNFADYYCARAGSSFGPGADALTRPDFIESLDQLVQDPTALSSWLLTYKSVYNYIVETKHED